MIRLLRLVRLLRSRGLPRALRPPLRPPRRPPRLVRPMTPEDAEIVAAIRFPCC